jgi:hypothetical protein
VNGHLLANRKHDWANNKLAKPLGIELDNIFPAGQVGKVKEALFGAD